MPLLAQALASSASIGREASEMSVSPAQNFSKPPPVPEVPTVTLTSGFSRLNSSAIASVSGPTVLEPSTRISPERFPLLPPSSSSSPPHAAAVSASTAEAAKTSHFLFIESLLFRLSKGGRLHRLASPRILYRRWTLSAGRAEVVTWVWRSCKKDVNALLRTPGKCGLGLRREAVADAGVGVDEAAAGQRPLELGPQPPYINVDGAV